MLLFRVGSSKAKMLGHVQKGREEGKAKKDTCIEAQNVGKDKAKLSACQAKYMSSQRA